MREDMSDALDRIAPEDRKGNLYRHSAEGLDDMPVSEFFFLFVFYCFSLFWSSTLVYLGSSLFAMRGNVVWLKANEYGWVTGAYQVRTDRRERDGTDQQRETGDGDMAGDLVFGVQGEQA